MIDMVKFEQDVRSGCKIACFGSRETPDRILQLMEGLGAKLVSMGAKLASGHCQGADLAWERGACRHAPENFTVCLPWRSYNKELAIHPKAQVVCLADLPNAQKMAYLQTARAHHPVWERLSPGAQLLHGRNILIGEGASYGFCMTSNRPGGGGSGQCKRYLESLGVPVIDFRSIEIASRWEQWRIFEGDFPA